MDTTNDYLRKVADDPKVFMIYISILVFSFFIITSYEHINHKFIAFIFMIVVLVFYHRHTLSYFNVWELSKSKFDNNIQIDETNDKYYHVNNVFDVTSKPKKLRYIYMNEIYLDIANSLVFVKTFDDYAYHRFVVLLESFLKMYYNVLVEDYDCVAYFPILCDLRIEILNHMSELFMNVPQFSNNVRGNIYEKIDRAIKQIQACTYKCIKIVSHQCKKLRKIDVQYKAPFPVVSSKDVDKHTLFWNPVGV